ncbi:MAG: hypothetical protein AAF950_04785 [Pseudomonadota bacterium]
MITSLPYTSTLVLQGSDTVGLLDRIVTCSIGDMTTGDSRPGALLTPQGKIISDFELTRTEAGSVLAVHPDAIDALEKRLKLFRLRADVEITRQEASMIDVDHDARIAMGRPCFGYDFAEAEVFPTDVNLDLFGGIDYKKGCFVGQEVVSRMYRRGKIRKRSVVLAGSGLEKDMDVRAGKKLLGRVTSAGDQNALAILRVDNLAKAMEADEVITAEKLRIEVVIADWLNEEMSAFLAGENA